MGFLDRLLGRSRDERSIPGMTGGGTPPGYGTPTPSTAGTRSGSGPATHRSADDVAIDRYRYLLRTAPPDAVEQAHAEAFARLTPEQRRQVLAEVGASVPASERATSDDPGSLARMATRAEMRNPGTLENTFRSGGPGAAAGARGPGFGSMMGSSLLGTVAGVVIGSAVANAMFGPAFGDPTTPVAEDAAAEDLAAEEGTAGDGGDPGADGGDGGDGGDAGVEAAGADAGGAETAGDGGMFGGLFGGDDGGGGLGDFFGGDGGGFDF